MFSTAFAGSAFSKLLVVTTTTDLNALVSEIGGSAVSTESLCKGTQDPHYLEAKPSFVMKLNRADLIVSVGLGLEVGWLPSILRSARNPKIMEGALGYLEVGPLVSVLEKQVGRITRAEGDVHPEGNPHVTLDPIRLGEIAVRLGQRMGELDNANAGIFKERANRIRQRLEQKTKDWQRRIKATEIRQVITHHKTLTYFLDRFQIKNPAILEPKPGIPPTSKHIIEVLGLVKAQKIPLIVIENYFDASVAERIIREVPQVRIVTVPVAVQGEKTITTGDVLFETLVRAIEAKP